ncbi:LacI family DNA-binding transcriptional regulator [Agrobacterium sp. rho-13.3]|jgi:DNA-binding LacI/PurR family transcriptional regulator|uniref:LacI family DNA-binding transcriptional regulator n=1 Tax=Agrobacterium sp. rho-13.3 TaxID=3072980 RepID=UPI002A0C4584|nr:substrate-binding domain-containing protein [Agrobacterium sp. rho-13.3]MDX8306788.1 substrate-binding domain-containing protein [Agrobacterium sp. rho-13.3]MDX8306881.1 substrate-binding domain-containing protein [Agrobacterium sp. rho-13.3]
MAKNFVTSIEVAERAGVSRSAVSRTFTAGASVSPDVRQRVLKAAGELGYRVNRLAQTLNTSSSNLVGVVGANLSSPFIAKQLDMLSLGLLRRGQQCLLLNAADARSNITPLIELIFEFRARAVVVLSGEPPASIIDECLANGVKLIVINRNNTREDIDVILSDDIVGAQLAANRLISARCRKIAIVCSGSLTPTQVKRATAFEERFLEQGGEVVRWSDGPTAYETGVAAAQALLHDTQIDGAFCVTDLMALGFLDSARQHFNRSVPDELCVVGFDNIPQSAWMAYNLTTIGQSFSVLTDSVLAALDHDDGHVSTQVVPVELIERGTVRS